MNELKICSESPDVIPCFNERQTLVERVYAQAKRQEAIPEVGFASAR